MCEDVQMWPKYKGYPRRLWQDVNRVAIVRAARPSFTPRECAQMQRTLAVLLGDLAEALGQTNSAALQMLAALRADGITEAQAMAMVNRMIDQQAYTMAVTDLFYLSAVLFFVLIGVIWVSRPKTGAAAGGGGAH